MFCSRCLCMSPHGLFVFRVAVNSTVRMYSNLLEHYATNSARTNHYILSFMMRLSNFTVSVKFRGKNAS